MQDKVRAKIKTMGKNRRSVILNREESSIPGSGRDMIVNASIREDMGFVQDAQDIMAALQNPDAKSLPDGTRINRKVSGNKTIVQVQDPNTRQWRDVLHIDRKTGAFMQGKGLITDPDAKAPRIFQAIGMPTVRNRSAMAELLPSGSTGATTGQPTGGSTDVNVGDTTDGATKSASERSVAPVSSRGDVLSRPRQGGSVDLTTVGNDGNVDFLSVGGNPRVVSFKDSEKGYNPGYDDWKAERIKRIIFASHKDTRREEVLTKTADAMTRALGEGMAYTGASSVKRQQQQDLEYKRSVYEHNRQYMPSNMQNLTDEQLSRMSMDEIRGGFGKGASKGNAPVQTPDEDSARQYSDDEDKNKQATVWGGWSRRDTLRSLMSAMKAGRTRRDFRYHRCL